MSNINLMHDELVAACANIGVDLCCGYCAAVFLTGIGTSGHDEGCRTTRAFPEPPKDVLCNLCGLSCMLGYGHHQELGGLIEKTVVGGYESTPGNGDGALDDTIAYTFSICEFCLDWLFERFTIPVVIGSDNPNDVDFKETWIPAAGRVAADDWRKMKQKFFDERARRKQARHVKLLALKASGIDVE